METASLLDAASRREPMTQKRIDLPRPVTEARMSAVISGTSRAC